MSEDSKKQLASDSVCEFGASGVELSGLGFRCLLLCEDLQNGFGIPLQGTKMLMLLIASPSTIELVLG